MTRPLLPHQSELLEQLTSDPLAERTLISAPVGVGLSTVLVEVATRAEANGERVMVVVDTRALLDQWAARLYEAGARKVLILSKATEALQSLDDPSAREPQIVLATMPALRHSLGRRAASSFAPALLILDQVRWREASTLTDDAESHTERVLAGLAARSKRVIVSVLPGGAMRWFDPTHRYEMSLADALAVLEVDVRITLVRYSLGGTEVDLYAKARELVQEASDVPVDRSVSLPGLHGALMNVAARLSGEQLESDEAIEPTEATQQHHAVRSGLLEEVWNTIDALEALEDDPRLRLLVDLVAEAQREDRGVLIVGGSRVDEVEYIAGRLRTNEVPSSVVTAQTAPAQRHRVPTELDDGRVVIVTRAVADAVVVPPETSTIWWSLPRTLAEAAQRVARGGTGGTIFALIAEPPLPDDLRFLSVIEELQRESGLRLLDE